MNAWACKSIESSGVVHEGLLTAELAVRTVVEHLACEPVLVLAEGVPLVLHPVAVEEPSLGTEPWYMLSERLVQLIVLASIAPSVVAHALVALGEGLVLVLVVVHRLLLVLSGLVSLVLRGGRVSAERALASFIKRRAASAGLLIQVVFVLAVGVLVVHGLG